MANDYQEYLANVHGKLATPDNVLADIVDEGTGEAIASKRRIISGEVNEVYDVSLENNQHVILRVSKHGYPDFIQEKWAIEQVEKLGVPVPRILFIKHFQVDGQDKSACVMEKIAGEPLERGNIKFDELDLALKRRLINQAGEILSRIHSVKTEGFGWIVGNGKPQFKTSDELIDRLKEKQPEFEVMVAEEGLGKDVVQRTLDIVESYRELYSQVTPCLNHGDYSHKHFMVEDSQIVGILDWGGIRSDSPAYDFAWWDYWFGEDIPTDWLKEGYTDKSLFDENFENLLHVIRLFRGLETMNWYHQEKYKPAVEKAKTKLLKDLEYFK